MIMVNFLAHNNVYLCEKMLLEKNNVAHVISLTLYYH